MRFDRATAVRWAGPGEFSTDLDALWGMGGNPNGGYLMAVLTRAALEHTGAPAPLLISAAFLRPAAHGPANLGVSTLRVGRTATHAQAELRQAGEPRVHATLVLGAASGPSTEPATPPDFPPESQCLPLSVRPDVHGLLDRVRVSYAPGFGPRDPGPPVVRGWVSLLSGEQPDLLVALLAADVLVPSVTRLGHRDWAPTVAMTVQLHREPCPGPLAVEVELGELRDGWFDEQATVHDCGGALIARGRQLARLPHPAP
jgi:hypothetical protein